MSEAANDTVWVGIDTPLAPQAFSVVDNGDGTAVATWQAVGDTGANGGYVNTNDVTYTIYDANGSVITTDIYDTSFTITGLNSQLPQVVTSFAVAAKNVAGESLKTNSDERHQCCQETGSYFLCKHSHWWSCSDSGSQR